MSDVSLSDASLADPSSGLAHAALRAARVWLVGGGRMGSALLTGWLDRGMPPEHVTVIDPAPVATLPAAVSLVADPAALMQAPGPGPDVLVVAVKPQMMESVLPAYQALGGGPAIVLSVAAGRTIAGFEATFGPTTPIVRSIPNTPAAVHQGMTVACANGHVSATGRETCAALLRAVGDFAWVEDESLIDAVTAVSGSGPAYVFWLTECLGAAGREAGLPDALADRLARVTVSGAGGLMALADEDPATLRRNVTSPGGTTAAALAELMAEADGLAPLMTRAVLAATRRSRELAG